MSNTVWEALPEETALLADFKAKHSVLFQKDDRKLFIHLATVIGLLIAGTLWVITTPVLILKILIGACNAFLWFCLINTTIHHHHTHHNAALSPLAKKFLDNLYKISMPNAPKRLNRYVRAHLNHHARPFHESDVDHHYGTHRFLEAMKDPKQAFLYFLDITFVGMHVPGWEDDRYMNTVPLEEWNQKDYARVMEEEKQRAIRTAAIQWGAFLLTAWIANWIPVLSVVAWGWAYPMLLVKNWSHFLGQFQHYDKKFFEGERTICEKTKTYSVPSWLNYLSGGEIAGHHIHHLFPELPYYNVETARVLFEHESALSRFVIK